MAKKRKLPPDPEKMNATRTASADEAMAAFMRRTGTDREDALSDLLVTNVKFFLGDDRNVPEEDLCREANAAREQERMGLAVPKPSLDAGIPRATVAKFLA